MHEKMWITYLSSLTLIITSFFGIRTAMLIDSLLASILLTSTGFRTAACLLALISAAILCFVTWQQLWLIVTGLLWSHLPWETGVHWLVYGSDARIPTTVSYYFYLPQNKYDSLLNCFGNLYFFMFYFQRVHTACSWYFCNMSLRRNDYGVQGNQVQACLPATVFPTSSIM